MELLYCFRQKKLIMSYIVQMFPRARGSNIFINRLDINVNSHQISVKYAKIHIKKYVLFAHNRLCFTRSKLFVEQLKILNFQDDLVIMQRNTYFCINLRQIRLVCISIV